MTVNRAAIRDLASHCGEGSEALDCLIAYAAISMCEPSGLSLLLTAAYTGFDLDQTHAALDRLVADGFVTPVTDTYIPTAA